MIYGDVDEPIMKVEERHSPMLQKWCQRSQWSGTMQFDEGCCLRRSYPLACARGKFANERRAESVMSQEETVRSILTSSDVSQLPVRGRVGLVV